LAFNFNTYSKISSLKSYLNKTLIEFKYNNSVNALVISNNKYSLGKNMFYKKITNYVRYSTPMSDYHRSVFIGILLGDAHIRKIGLEKNNARISFKQSMSNFPYCWYVFTELFSYCSSFPRLEWTKIGTKKYCLIIFGTRNYPCLNELYDMFIDKGKKRVPVDIYNELTPIALAHWIMCDGGFLHKGLILCTDSFDIKDVINLMNVLLIKYNISSTIHRSGNLPRIYISRKEIHKLVNIVNDHIIPFSKYKFTGLHQ